MWRSTSLSLIVEAIDEEAAWQQAARYVRKMLGGMSCLEIKVKELS